MSIEENYDIRFIASLALREKQIQQKLQAHHRGSQVVCKATGHVVSRVIAVRVWIATG